MLQLLHIRKILDILQTVIDHLKDEIANFTQHMTIITVETLLLRIPIYITIDTQERIYFSLTND